VKAVKFVITTYLILKTAFSRLKLLNALGFIEIKINSQITSYERCYNKTLLKPPE
jgi:hypothetical protein